jgi:hypothetical protein
MPDARLARTRAAYPDEGVTVDEFMRGLDAALYRYARQRMEQSLKDGVLRVPLPPRFQNRDDPANG